MNQPAIFLACVPVLRRYLSRLSAVVQSVEHMPPQEQSGILRAQLASDMQPFYRQVETAAYFAVRTAFPLAGREVPPFRGCIRVEAANSDQGSEPTVAGLLQLIAESDVQLKTLSPQEFDAAPGRIIHEKAGLAEIELIAEEFLSQYALPNFFFHLSMAYAIARQAGCALGKAQFDGFHVYASKPSV